MKIGDLIRQLSTLRAQHKTDFEVMRWNSCCCYGDDEVDIENVELQPNDGHPYVVLS
ncbi:hypothetical protein [Mycolicibacterium aichiense]|uniref:Uncharacterized protein n=1 Tax=Mycolicibacterium aichiense TaxID=1799 RepID=A0A378VDR2_9MYCO|nr:hypothetical protein [Mycolicibacterium aichiense]QFG08002.1 hypothetical protein SEA_HERBERTWM_33 [Mycobacterium phage Herbertwm]MCV7016787.1 hypothetical protein [Mycolicibacterium aichiense]SUA13994.1 Uncharacterised protein [Mycolicibacterium aichiense]SUA14428.1 Uncharacterised protein [Mycolicibacterium aichiense]BBX09429.1 hypothetical protein MAIC_42320 [Mycolicibacterium aichiense]